MAFFEAIRKHQKKYGFRAHIGKNVQIGKNTNVYETFCYIGDNVVIGDNVQLSFGDYIGDYSHIGSNSTIEPGTILAPYTIMGSLCTVGANVTSQGSNIIGNLVRIHNQSQIGAGLIIEDRVFIGPRLATANAKIIKYGGRRGAAKITPSCIKFGARIGSGVTLLPNISIGREAFIGAGSVVTKDIPPFTLAYGNPAKPVREIPVDERLPEHMYKDFREMQIRSINKFGFKLTFLGAARTVLRQIVGI